MGEDMHNIQPTSLSNAELVIFAEDMLGQDLPLPRDWALELVKRFNSEYDRGYEEAEDLVGSRGAYYQGYEKGYEKGHEDGLVDQSKPSYICDECGSEK